jgi:hypothetical protein
MLVVAAATLGRHHHAAASAPDAARALRPLADAAAADLFAAGLARSPDHVTAAHHPAASHCWAVTVTVIVSSLGLLAILSAAVATS